MAMNCAICFGNFIEYFEYFDINFMKFELTIRKCYFYRCYVAQQLYDEIMNNKNDEQSKISFQTIDYITTLFTNFAKYG